MAADIWTVIQQFTVYRVDELCTVYQFKYLGWISSNDDNVIPAMYWNLKRAWATWGRISKNSRPGKVPAPVAGMLYQAVAVAVLLCGNKSWGFSPQR